MGVKLTQVLTEIGDENIRLQFIKGSLVGFREMKHDLEITFATEKQNKPLDGNKHMGIVIWIDEDSYNEAIEKLSGE